MSASFRQSGLGFLNVSNDGAGSADDYSWYDPTGDYNFGFDFGSGGDYSGSWPSFDFIALPDLQAPPVSPSANEDRYWFDWGQYLSDWLNGNVLSIDTYGQQGSGQQPFGGSFNWPTGIPGPGPASVDPQYGPAGTGQGLPGYCPGGTYHPLNDPNTCVPFPSNDPNAKRQADAQRKVQQAAANAAKKAQQQQNATCPKDPLGRPIWKNPSTGKCELVPTCPQGSKFDSTTRRCLTAAQAKELYGDNSWLWWLLGGAALLMVLNNNGGGRRR
jgi:hypothetical protein